MAVNLPSILPTDSSKSVNSTATSGRAQDLSVSDLNYKKDIKNAKISIGDVTGEHTKAVTSISHAGENGGSKAVTSVAHIGEQLDEDNEMYAKGADDRRYAYIRRLVTERKAKEAAQETKEKASVSTVEKSPFQPSHGQQYAKLKVKTGRGLRVTGITSLHRQLYKMWKQNPESFKNISAEDRKYYEKLVTQHAKAVTIGKGFGRLVRKNMKSQVERDRQAGRISYADSQDFKRMIDNLPHNQNGG